MIHEEKLNGALNSFSFPRFRSPRPCTTVPHPHLRRPTVSITYRFLPSTFRFISIARSAFVLSHDLLFFFLSVCLSAYPSIHLSIFSPVYLSVFYIILSSVFRDKPFYRHVLLLTIFHLISHSGDSSKFSHLSRERWMDFAQTAQALKKLI